MKILFLPRVKNLFFSKLAEGLGSFAMDVSSDAENLWADPFKYDVLHIHFPEAFYCWDRCKPEGNESLCAEKFLRRLKELKSKGVTIVWTVHNLEPHDRVKSDLDREFFDTFIGYCDGIIIQCRKAEKLLAERYPDSTKKITKIIPHINYTDCYPNNISRQEARAQLGYRENDFIFLSFGLIRTYKNIPLLINAFKKISTKQKNARLLIAGAVSEDIAWNSKFKIFYSSLLNSRITLRKQYIKDDDVQVFFNAADVGVFSYKKIFMSGAVILAQSFGLPVIAPDSGCMADLVSSETGFLYETGNHEDLEQKMLKAMSVNLNKMQRQAREFQIKNNYLVASKNTFEFYQELMEYNK